MKKLFFSKMAGFLATMMIVSTLLPVVAFAEFADVQNDEGTVTGNVYVTGLPVTEDKVEVIDNSTLTNLFNANADATLVVTSELVSLNAEGLAKGKSLTLKLANGTSITLPIAALKLDELAKSLGVASKDLQIHVEMKKLTGSSLTAITDAATANGATLLSDPVDFRIYAEANDKKQEVNKLGVYFNRTLPVKSSSTVTGSVYSTVTGSVYSTVTGSVYNTGAVYNPTTKELSFVPSTFAASNDSTIATLKRNSLSIYAVVQMKAVSFTDTTTHWAKEDITKLASKLIAEGMSDNMFAPERDITRAEFAALVVRSLGLDAVGSTSAFSDVALNKWYVGAVAAAIDAKLIEGYNGSFRPDAKITRSEVAAIVVRALTYAGKEVTLTEEQVSSALANFSDASTLGWAREEIAAALSTEIVKGQSATKLAGSSNASRAEAATMIARFLTNAEFIN
ncbi:MAG: S-layer homology domain-containing protein [Bacillota bacterium]